MINRENLRKNPSLRKNPQTYIKSVSQRQSQYGFSFVNNKHFFARPASADRHIDELVDTLECPVCLDTADREPIYQCPEGIKHRSKYHIKR
jgi:hypothetical protein